MLSPYLVSAARPPLLMRLPSVVIALAMLLNFGISQTADADDWGALATISSTMGVNEGRLCIGEASRGDIGCPSYAPTVSSTGNFGLTNGLTVNSVSLSTAGTTWGYMSSVVSYLPNLNTNNISTSTINGVPFTGNANTDRIVSGTSSLSIDSGGIVSHRSGGNSKLALQGNGANFIELGDGRTTNNYAYIDLIGDATYSDYGLRLIRDNVGPNANSWLQHRGTGGLHLMTQEAGPIVFRTTNTERMRIHANGQIGVGTSSPQETLSVSGTGVAFEMNSAGVLRFTSSGNANYIQSAPINPNTGDFRDLAITPWYSGTPHLLIKADGNVGIGTNTPSAKLDVNGTVKATSFQGDGTSLTNVTANNADLLDGLDSTAFVKRSGDSMAGGLTLQGTGTNGLYNGTGDGASYTTHNFILKGHFGMGLATYDNSVNGFYDFRSGTWDVKGGYRVNGTPVWHAANDGAGSGADADLLDGLDSTAFVKRSGDSMGGNLTINNGGPVLTMQDTDGRSAFLHTNANTFYVLNSAANNQTTWTQNGSYWPLTINLANDDATFGGSVSIPEGTLWLGNTRLQNDGNLYMPWAGDWLSNVLNSKISAGGTFGGDNVFTLYGTTANENIWSPPLEIREINQVGAAQNGNNAYAPGITFHWSGLTAAAIKMYSDGSFRFRSQSNDTNAYRNVYANNLWLTDPGDWVSNAFLRRYTNQWITSSEGQHRFNFANSGRTYIKAGNSDGIIATFRDSADNDRMHIASNGNVWLGYLGDWMSNRLDQSVRVEASPFFSNGVAKTSILNDGGIRLERSGSAGSPDTAGYIDFQRDGSYYVRFMYKIDENKNASVEKHTRRHRA